MRAIVENASAISIGGIPTAPRSMAGLSGMSDWIPRVCAVRTIDEIPEASPTRTDAEFIDCSNASRTVTVP